LADIAALLGRRTGDRPLDVEYRADPLERFLAIGDPLDLASSKKPRRTCAQQATSATRGGPASGSREEDAPAIS
jgi:hypothetical protein